MVTKTKLKTYFFRYSFTMKKYWDQFIFTLDTLHSLIYKHLKMYQFFKIMNLALRDFADFEKNKK